MRELLFALIIGVLFSPYSFSQITGTTSELSGGNENHDSTINVSSPKNDDEFFNSLNIKQTNSFALIDDIPDVYMIGFALELEFETSREIGVTVSLNPIFSTSGGGHKDVIWISAGPKFYFNKSELRGFAGIQGCLAFSLGEGPSGFAIAPSLGLDYKINRIINIGMESQLHAGIGIGSSFVLLSFNPFVRIMF